VRVAIYARVSTLDQNCELQIDALRAYLKARKWKLAPIPVPSKWQPHKFRPASKTKPNSCAICKQVALHALHTGRYAEYVDSGWSGKNTERPEFQRIMHDARLRNIDCVVVWKLDRWGRSISDSLNTIQELRSIAVRWLAFTQNLDTDESNPMSRLMLNIMAAFAEFEREIIRERTGAGLKRYREDYAEGKVGLGRSRRSRSGKDLPVGRPRRVFDRDRARELRLKGVSLQGIADLLKVGRGTVQRLLVETPCSGY